MENETFYVNAVLLMGIVMATLSLTIMGLRSESFKNNITLRYSRRNMALAFLVLSANAFLHYHFRFRLFSPSVAIALDISAYFLVAILLALTYIPLLDPNYRSIGRIIRFIALWLVCGGSVWLASLCVYGTISLVLQILSGVVLLYAIVDIAVCFSRVYNKERAMLTESTVENVDKFSAFLTFSLILLILLGIGSSVICLMDDIAVHAYYHVIATLLFWRLFMSYANYICSLRN